MQSEVLARLKAIIADAEADMAEHFSDAKETGERADLADAEVCLLVDDAKAIVAALSAAEPVGWLPKRKWEQMTAAEPWLTNVIYSEDQSEFFPCIPIYAAPHAPPAAVKALEWIVAHPAESNAVVWDVAKNALSAQVLDVAGWQLVPKEPTQEMLDACGPKPKHWDATPSSRRVRESADRMRREDYKTMLSAAPAKQEGKS
ncbi:hypothetical protein [Agrobacterium tumefaciens]|uniref:hypothetical protein n=1 Tax=Agrobacterium tumefaciens TaxID=358 RepID=UPI0021CEC4F3|nr:hypothetical protein [Agrobacterium tumefaciens]UXS01682.1 hypothetical protein FY156_09485 [Agrobacterium tumefaciens]